MRISDTSEQGKPAAIELHQSSKVLPLKPGTSPCTAVHATPTAIDFYLANVYIPGPFMDIFFKSSPEFFLCWLWLIPVPV